MYQTKFYDLKPVARDICISILRYLSAAPSANFHSQEVMSSRDPRGKIPECELGTLPCTNMLLWSVELIQRFQRMESANYRWKLIVYHQGHPPVGIFYQFYQFLALSGDIRGYSVSYGNQGWTQQHNIRSIKF